MQPTWQEYMTHDTSAEDPWRVAEVWRRAFELLATWNKANGDTDQRDFDDAFAQAWKEVHGGE